MVLLRFFNASTIQLEEVRRKTRRETSGAGEPRRKLRAKPRGADREISAKKTEPKKYETILFVRVRNANMRKTHGPKNSGGNK
jgi:hypothetical protein